MALYGPSSPNVVMQQLRAQEAQENPKPSRLGGISRALDNFVRMGSPPAAAPVMAPKSPQEQYLADALRMKRATFGRDYGTSSYVPKDMAAAMPSTSSPPAGPPPVSASSASPSAVTPPPVGGDSTAPAAPTADIEPVMSALEATGGDPEKMQGILSSLPDDLLRQIVGLGAIEERKMEAMQQASLPAMRGQTVNNGRTFVAAPAIAQALRGTAKVMGQRRLNKIRETEKDELEKLALQLKYGNGRMAPVEPEPQQDIVAMLRGMGAG